MSQNQKKIEIRQKIKNIRENLDPKIWEEKSLKIQKTFLSLDYYRNAKVIFTYFHFDREVKTDFIIKECFKDKKIVCLPYIEWKNKVMIASIIDSFNDININGKIPTPKVLKPFDENLIDVIIIPGVVFDIYRNRIGMGGGFYDRFLKKGQTKTKKIAFAFEFQILDEELPVEPNDAKVDFIITENRIIGINDK